MSDPASPFLEKANDTTVPFELEGKFRVGGCSMQGWRRNMEDSHIAILDVFGDNSASFFCVCDGHGGSTCATEVTDHIHQFLLQCPMFQKADRQYAEGLAWVVGKAEEYLLALHNQQKLPPCGTTFVGILITDQFIYCANVGDSRAVMCRKGKAVDLSRDHKPSSPAEIARVTQVGGQFRNGRLNGLLAMTRALGDFELKNPKKPAQKQPLIAVPEVSSCPRNLQGKPKAGSTQLPEPSEANFVVLACDGIWDCLTSQEVVNFFLEENVADPDSDVGGLCEELTKMLVAPRLQAIGSDNMTVMVVVLKPQTAGSSANLGRSGEKNSNNNSGNTNKNVCNNSSSSQGALLMFSTVTTTHEVNQSTSGFTSPNSSTTKTVS